MVKKWEEVGLNKVFAFILFGMVMFGGTVGVMMWLNDVKMDVLTEKVVTYAEKKYKGLEDRQVALDNQIVTFKSGRIGTVGVVVEFKDAPEDVEGYSFMLQNHLLGYVAEQGNEKMNGFTPGYKKSVTAYAKTMNLEVKEVYMQKYVIP